MAIIEFDKDSIIYESGAELSNLYLIMRGSVRFANGSDTMVLRNGDVIGLSDLGNMEVMGSYVALDKTSVMVYPMKGAKLWELLAGNKDSIRFFQRSLFKQLNEVIGFYKLHKLECTNLHDYVIGCYEDYKEISEKNGISPVEPERIAELGEFIPEADAESWLTGYYSVMEQLLQAWDHNQTDSDFLTGFILKTGDDIRGLLRLCMEMKTYQEELCNILVNEGKSDLLELYMNLYGKLLHLLGPDDDTVGILYRGMNDMIMQIEMQKNDQKEFLKERRTEMEEQMSALLRDQALNAKEEEKQNPKIVEELKGSLSQILTYSGVSKETANSFTEHIEAYRKTTNKNGTEDKIRALRAAITREFNEIYISAFQMSVMNLEPLPKVLSMFFNFGYVDEGLAGISNAVYMYELIDHMPTNPDKGVYSYYEWLMAIYKGEKDPGRNEFDMDYSEHLHEMEHGGKITKEEEQSLLTNASARVMYELENVFPVVNKTTFGRISIFCPVFSEHNLVKNLSDSIVSAQKVLEIIDEVRKVDFGAFYRETVFFKPEVGVPKEYIHVEVLPNFILTPNAGSRGVMWQEIEGKKRTTPSRMMISVFQMEDLQMMVMRLVGQFRWEMCKRVQGARWNDVTDHSLTSEYFDYVQFYKKNKDLSPEAKEKIHNDMTRAKNSFKEMFIRDYCTWIQFESQGSPRLNKVAREILFTYCTFSASIRAKLEANPMYRELADKYRLRNSQKIRRMDNLIVKIQNLKKEIPLEIQEERAFLDR